MKWPQTRLTELLGLDYPIVQAPLATISTAPLVSAVADSGGLGSLGSALMSADELTAQVELVRQQTSRGFALNFFVHEPPVEDAAALLHMRARLEPYRRELGVAELPPLVVQPPFDDVMLERVLALAPRVVSFHFGCPERRVKDALSAARIFMLGTATSVREARALEAFGMDAIVAQGFEAGGHRGTFLSEHGDGQIGTLALVPQVVDQVSVPVIAAGGIADGRGIAAALMLGASGAQLGTAFLGCPEARLDPLYRRTLLGPRAEHTRITSVLSGRPARAILTRFIIEMEAEEDRAPDFPLQRPLVQALAHAATARGDAEFSAMWAGQAAPLLRELPAAELFTTLIAETETTLERFSAWATPRSRS